MTAAMNAIEALIIRLRGYERILSVDLAKLLGMSHGAFLGAARDILAQLPKDMAFQLSGAEIHRLRAMLERRGRRPLGAPWALTSHSVIAVSSVFRSKRKIAVTIEVARAFTRFYARMERSSRGLVDLLDNVSWEERPGP